MERNLFDKIIKVLWIIVACVSLYIFYPKIKTIDRYEVVMGRGKTVYRFDTSKGIFAKGTIPDKDAIHYEYDKDGFRYTIEFLIPEYDGTDIGYQDAVKERQNTIDNWISYTPNAKKIITLRFEDIIK